MESDILQFCKAYKKSISKNNKNNISFSICLETTIPTNFIILSSHDILLELDNEDLKYLYDKYSKKLKSEKQKAIKKIENQYNLD